MGAAVPINPRMWSRCPNCGATHKFDFRHTRQRVKLTCLCRFCGHRYPYTGSLDGSRVDEPDKPAAQAAAVSDGDPVPAARHQADATEPAPAPAPEKPVPQEPERPAVSPPAAARRRLSTPELLAEVISGAGPRRAAARR